jgi:hypothetical protein
MAEPQVVPVMWREMRTDDQQDVYYFNEDTAVSQWEPPADWFRALNGMLGGWSVVVHIASSAGEN